VYAGYPRELISRRRRVSLVATNEFLLLSTLFLETGYVLPRAPWEMHAELRDFLMARNDGVR
jgi:hypothetical protein